MRLLLDTHALLLCFDDSPRLGAVARAHITDGANAVFVSAASAWEIEIKRALGKLEAPADVMAAIESSHFEPLPIDLSHGIAAGRLERHHADPFDRMLIAQAMTEQLAIVTKDGAFADYNVAVLDAES